MNKNEQFSISIFMKIRQIFYYYLIVWLCGFSTAVLYPKHFRISLIIHIPVVLLVWYFEYKQRKLIKNMKTIIESYQNDSKKR